MELKPCPFCGSTVKVASQRLRSPHIPRTIYYIYCDGCLQEFFYSSVKEDKIITKWNRRIADNSSCEEQCEKN